jgi:glycosyltransferase involved in cell wall biosynthesis
MTAFSVITPVFNGGKYLARSIRSVLAQTLPDFELIVVDDGSTDDAVREAASCEDSRLRILTQANSGAPNALNYGISVARGEYIALLDADDIWAPNKLQVQFDCFQKHPEADMAFTGLTYIDPDDQPMGLPRREAAGSFDFDQLFIDYVVGSSSVVAARREAVVEAGGFDPAMLYLFDIDLVLRISRLRSRNILGIPEPLTLYRRHPGQQTSDWRTIAAYWEKLVGKLKRQYPAQVERLERRARMNMARYFSYLAYEQGDPSTAWSLLRRGWKAHPIAGSSDLRNWKLGAAYCAELLLPTGLNHWLIGQAGLRHIQQRPRIS